MDKNLNRPTLSNRTHFWQWRNHMQALLQKFINFNSKINWCAYVNNKQIICLIYFNSILASLPGLPCMLIGHSCFRSKPQGTGYGNERRKYNRCLVRKQISTPRSGGLVWFPTATHPFVRLVTTSNSAEPGQGSAMTTAF